MASKKKTAMTKQELKGHVDKAEMDLSLCELSSLPVRDMLTYTRVTRLDLSCNLLQELPEELCEMRQLQRLDLSKNVLAFLPQSIGHLDKLRELDLFSNRLSSLPLGFSQLTQLKWLDVKNNMLDSQLVSVAGTCVDARECEDCAKSVVRFMRTKAAEAERAHQENLQRERRALERQKELTDRENAERRRQKQELKQQRREEREAELRQRKTEDAGREETGSLHAERKRSVGFNADGGSSSSSRCWPWVLLLLLVLAGVALSAYVVFCVPNDQMCRDTVSRQSQQAVTFFKSLQKRMTS